MSFDNLLVVPEGQEGLCDPEEKYRTQAETEGETAHAQGQDAHWTATAEQQQCHSLQAGSWERVPTPVLKGRPVLAEEASLCVF